MSTTSYKQNHHIFWIVQCSFITKGKKHIYNYKGAEQSYTKSLKDAKENCLWGNHPTFEARVVGIRYE